MDLKTLIAKELSDEKIIFISHSITRLGGLLEDQVALWFGILLARLRKRKEKTIKGMKLYIVLA